MVEEGELTNTIGFPYLCDETGEEMVEVHVDDHSLFQEWGSQNTFGGPLSVLLDQLVAIQSS